MAQRAFKEDHRPGHQVALLINDTTKIKKAICNRQGAEADRRCAKIRPTKGTQRHSLAEVRQYTGGAGHRRARICAVGHSDQHVAAVLTPLGTRLGSASFAATAAGYQELVASAATFGVLRRAGVEGTGSCGAALARHLRAAGIEVIEVNAPDKATRRRRGKTDRHCCIKRPAQLS